MSDEQKSLSHYGVKGMKWGVRKRDRGSNGPVKVRTSHKPGGRVKTKGGENQKASPDAVRAAVARQKARKSTTDSLSNKELQDLVTRMNLEQQYARLDPKKENLGLAFLKTGMLGAMNQQAQKQFGNNEDPRVQRALKVGDALGTISDLAVQNKKGKKK